MVRRQFKIIHYIYFTAIASLVFAVIFGPHPQILAFFGLSSVILLLLSILSPILLPLSPRSPESRLLRLPEDPDERTAVLERLVARPLWLRSGAKRSARIKLVQLYRKHGRDADAVNLGLLTLDRFRMSPALENLLRLELATCLNRLGRHADARVQLERVSTCLQIPSVSALDWLVRGRFLETLSRYDESIAAYEYIMSLPLFDRKPVDHETCLRLAVAYVNAGRPAEAVRLAELALKHERSSSSRLVLHRAASMAYSMLQRPDAEERRMWQARAIASEVGHNSAATEPLAAPGPLA